MKGDAREKETQSFRVERVVFILPYQGVPNKVLGALLVKKHQVIRFSNKFFDTKATATNLSLEMKTVTRVQMLQVILLSVPNLTTN